MSNARSEAVCTYCDRLATTDDHVPPKLLFSKPRPHLITVRSCQPCNQSSSLDDEYFRAVIALEENAAKHPEAALALSSVIRSFQKPRKQRFTRAFLSSVRSVERISPQGLYLGKASSFKVDLSRLSGVVERTTRGLFRHHMGRRLPLECEVRSFASSGFGHAGPEVRRTLLELVEHTRINPLHTIGNDVFSYRFAIASDQANSSAWVFVVYRAISFFSLAIDPIGPTPRDEAA